ncbi:MAG: hypothetical protein AABZ15_11790 [Nitrospirota bacterium]
MNISVKSNTNVEAMMKRLGEDVAGGLIAGTTTVLETADALISPEVPVKTSNLVNSGTIEISPDGRKGVLRWLADYGRYVVEGTGLFGPFKRKIVPKNAKALKTPWGPRKSIKGQEPNDFITRGVEKLNPPEAFEEGMGRYLKKKGW